MLVTSPPVVFQRSFIDITGSAISALLLSGYVDIQDTSKTDSAGWFDVPYDEIQWRTGLSAEEQKSAEVALITKKMIGIRVAPRVVPYKPGNYQARVNFDQISLGLINYAKTAAARRNAAQMQSTGNPATQAH